MDFFVIAPDGSAKNFRGTYTIGNGGVLEIRPERPRSRTKLLVSPAFWQYVSEVNMGYGFPPYEDIFWSKAKEDDKKDDPAGPPLR